MIPSLDVNSLLGMGEPTNPRTIRPRERVWEAVPTVAATTMAAIYGGKIQYVLKNPAGRQKIAPRAVTAPARS